MGLATGPPGAALVPAVSAIGRVAPGGRVIGMAGLTLAPPAKSAKTG
jgi:hypothetical protein